MVPILTSELYIFTVNNGFVFYADPDNKCEDWCFYFVTFESSWDIPHRDADGFTAIYYFFYSLWKATLEQLYSW